MRGEGERRTRFGRADKASKQLSRARTGNCSLVFLQLTLKPASFRKQTMLQLLRPHVICTRSITRLPKPRLCAPPPSSVLPPSLPPSLAPLTPSPLQTLLHHSSLILSRFLNQPRQTPLRQFSRPFLSASFSSYHRYRKWKYCSTRCGGFEGVGEKRWWRREVVSCSLCEVAKGVRVRDGAELMWGTSRYVPTGWQSRGLIKEAGLRLGDVGKSLGRRGNGFVVKLTSSQSPSFVRFGRGCEKDRYRTYTSIFFSFNRVRKLSTAS